MLNSKKGEAHNEATTINTLIIFAKASIQHNQDFDIGSDVWSPVVEMIIKSSNIHNPSCQLSAYNGLIVLAAYLTQEQRAIIYEGCEDALKSDESVKVKCIELLKKLARIHPSEIMDKVVDTKLKLTSNEDTNHQMQDWQTETLCGLVILPQFVNEVCGLLMDLIENNPKSAPKILSCLRSLLTNEEVLENEGQVLEVICRLCLKRLVEWWLEGFHKLDSCHHNSTLQDVAVVIENLVKSQSSLLQAEVVCPLVETVITPRGAEGDGSNYKDIFKKSKHSVIILQALLGYVQPNVKIKHWLPLTTSLADVAFSEKDALIRDSASELLATLINKQQNDEVLATILGHTAKHLEQKLASRDSKSKVNAVKLLSWVTKSLVLRGHGLMAYWIDKLTDQLADCKEPGREAADGFRLIVEEDKLFLIAKSNSMLRIFYRQRFFQRALSLASMSRTCSRACKPNYLTALAYLVQSVPKSVLLPSLRQIMIPLVESLDEGEDKLELTTLNTLSGLLAEKEPALLSYTDTFIPRFLKLAKESHSMKVRIGALECLKFYASYPPVQIVPYVEDVTTELQPCLDDRKRLVRFAAVNARSAWFLVNHHLETPE
ncbi:MMS19 nucleotide excision repair protein homolog isoform X2 [Nilaparvata lugens]|uniref:MMS19 nucleotide excision repair protein homolog isoform X1 n=1 Tax=Nilaparvata lugens TaxID=108931 RepID=UPI00193E4DE9|nr:MMS19 nucleotide excision repair protein homolog isoform X1 [Nilaparvata lugens]XP_039282790.1 MMS19 nucleotide excision repair protein homolog isoform X2 [Nilaparvata lugens]